MHFRLQDKLFNACDTTLWSGFLIALNTICISHFLIILSLLSFFQIITASVK